MAHREFLTLPPALVSHLIQCVNFVCVRVCVTICPAVLTLSMYMCTCLINGNCVGVLLQITLMTQGMTKTLQQTNTDILCGPVWSALHYTLVQILPTGQLNILRYICYQKKECHQPVEDKFEPNMYLKAACSEIPVPRQRGGPRLDRCPSSIQQRQGAGTRLYLSSPTSSLSGAFEASRPREQQSLEELLQVHSHFFQPCASMVYRYDMFWRRGHALKSSKGLTTLQWMM